MKAKPYWTTIETKHRILYINRLRLSEIELRIINVLYWHAFSHLMFLKTFERQFVHGDQNVQFFWPFVVPYVFVTI